MPPAFRCTAIESPKIWALALTQPGPPITTLSRHTETIRSHDRQSALITVQHTVVKSQNIPPGGHSLPIQIQFKANERMGQLRKFTLAANPGDFAAVDQASGEPKKTYSWHVLLGT